MLNIRRHAVGLALAAAVATSFGLAGSPALASAAAAPAAPASYHTWRAAQRAAGFKLVSPSRTYGLKRVSAIGVQHCGAGGKTSKHEVFATYGAVTGQLLAFVQDNAGGPCGHAESGKPLGTYRVHGVIAHLAGICGVHGQPSCHSRKIFLLLSWTHHGIYVQVVSHNVRRGTIVGFARGLRRVS
jgi:hypothetical protein